MSLLNDIKKLIELHHRRLQKLKEQAALFGAHTPPHILIEIEDIEAKITELTDLKNRQAVFQGMLTPPPGQAEPPEAVRQYVNDCLAGLDRDAQNLNADLDRRLQQLAAIFDQRNQQVDEQTNIAVSAPGGTAIGQAGVVNINPPADPHQARLADLKQQYLANLARACNALPLAALGGDDKAETAIKLENVYIDLDTTTRVPLAEDEKKPNLGRDDRAITAMEAALKESYLVLVGEPGSGKSTFVKQLAGLLAQSRQNPAKRPPGWPDMWPVLTNWRALAPRLSAPDLAALPPAQQSRVLVDAVRQQWQDDCADLRVSGLAAYLDDVLHKEKLLLIFDGLDEIPANLRPLARQAVWAVIKAYPAIGQVIVTCRARSYEGRAVLNGFVKYELAPFDEEKISRFIQCWYQSQTPGLPPSRAASLEQDLRQNALGPKLRPLAENPLLLTTMAVIHQQDTKLPDQRVKLYDRAVEILLNKWQEHKGLTVAPALQTLLADKAKISFIVQRLAYEFHAHQAKQGQEAKLTRKDLTDLLEKSDLAGDLGLAGQFLEYMDVKTGLLTGLGGGEEGQKPVAYDFPHRTFQEYLAGCYMVYGGGYVTRYNERVQEGDFWYVAACLGAEHLLHNNPSQGKPALLNLAFNLCPEQPPRAPEAARRALWAGYMAALLGPPTIAAGEGVLNDKGQAYLERQLLYLQQILTSNLLTLRERAEAGDALSRLGDLRPGVTTLPLLLTPPLAGKFIYGDNEKREITVPFQAGVYPVTNAQFDLFMQAGGYKNKAWWSDEGWQWLQNPPKYRQKSVTQPEYWGNERFNQANQPVVGVSWYEAEAFCLWLTAVYGRGRTYRLPTEEEWERLARGPLPSSVPPGGGEAGGADCPWGNDWREGVCNTDECGLNRTSAVGMFPDGVNPVTGAHDCAGNVWEWCASWYDKNKNAKVLRGGAWTDISDYARARYRDYYQPDFSDDNLGFRCVVSAPG